MSNMVSKETERKALAKIKDIVDGLGNDSYIATAFEGCFEKAEENIENDWACSYKQEAEYYKAEAESARKTIEDLRDSLQVAGDSNLEIQKERDSYKTAYDELIVRERQDVDRCMALMDERSVLSLKVKELEDELIHLKAKMYDMMVKGGEQ